MTCMFGLTLLRIAPCQTAGHTFEDASIAFIRTYMEQWSSPNPEAMAYMNKVFPNEAMYFDQTLSHAQLMQAKHRFTERWPQRHFVVRDNDLSVSCDQRHLCTVWGLVDWHCRSLERHAEAIGTSVFAFQVQDGQTVLDEDGFVIARGRILPRDATAKAVAPMIYSNADIPKLRQAYYDDSVDPDWIANWLAAQRPFSGTARSLGQASARDLTDSNGVDMPYAVFQSDQGPIACMMRNKRPMPPLGEAVHLHGTVAIFIDTTMYLSRCSFG
jgi:hypothetical protein